jgi:hypothetical protein
MACGDVYLLFRKGEQRGVVLDERYIFAALF